MKTSRLQVWINGKMKVPKEGLLFLSFFFLTTISFGQLPSEFWGAFDKCTTILQFQSHYTVTAPGAPFSHNVMDHGVDIPSTSGITFGTGSLYNILDKNAMITGGNTNFFVINTYDVDASHATFDFAFYYNFTGGYNHFVKALVVLDYVNGEWVISQSNIQ